VATGALSPGEIASPLRVVLRRSQNTQVLLGEMIDLDAAARAFILKTARWSTIADRSRGIGSQLFRNMNSGRSFAPALKTIEDATEIRSRILLAFERRKRESTGNAARSAC